MSILNLVKSEQLTKAIEHMNHINSKPISVSSRYNRIDSMELIERTAELLTNLNYHDFDVKVIQGGGIKSTKHFIEFKLNDYFDIDGGLKPRIYIVNSYNGECSAQFRVGLLRLVCANGLMLGSDYFSMNVVHLNTANNIQKLSWLEREVTAALDKLSGVKELIGRLTRLELTEEEQVKAVEFVGLSERITKRVFQLLLLQRHGSLRAEDSNKNAWTLYNIVNEALGAYTRTEGRKLTTNMELLPTIIKAIEQVKRAA